MIIFSGFIKRTNDFLIQSSELENLKNSTTQVSAITNNTKKIIDNSIFFAINSNSLKYFLNDFHGQNLFCMICDIALKNDSFFKEIEKKCDKILFSQNINIRKLHCDFVVNFYKLIQFPLKICAITGTNGKSSTAFFYKQLCNFIGLKACSIGTIGIYSDDEAHKELPLTTPDISELCEIINSKAKNNIFDIAIEASSHGLEQYRVDGLPIEVAGFTNFTQDHLDYHQNMDNYWLAKARLFKELGIQNIVINNDDGKSVAIKEICADLGLKYITYGAKNESDINLLSYKMNDDFSSSLEIEILDKKYNFHANLIGEFQMYNLMLAIGMILFTHKDKFELIFFPDGGGDLKDLQSPSGRMEMVKINENSVGIIDYAHTPDALEKLLTTIKDFFPENKKEIVLIFGCGGERDKEKRKIMGEIANKYSDFIIVTDDNPRNENSQSIRNEIISGISDKKKFIEIGNRFEAIKYGLDFAIQNKYQLVIAGKGHENTQIIGNIKHSFNDKEVLISLKSSS